MGPGWRGGHPGLPAMPTSASEISWDLPYPLWGRNRAVPLRESLLVGHWGIPGEMATKEHLQMGQ